MTSSNSPIYELDLIGAQTMRGIQATYARVSDVLARYDAVAIRCDSVSELDVSLIQLLLAAKRSADKAGKTLTIAAPVAGPLHAALDRAGFLAAGDAEFWTKSTGVQ